MNTSFSAEMVLNRDNVQCIIWFQETNSPIDVQRKCRHCCGCPDAQGVTQKNETKCVACLKSGVGNNCFGPTYLLYGQFCRNRSRQLGGLRH
ncbi:hypothetical protein TNCV_1779301 [Trichonephila clavipes]|nr:hypothetical protein TNCV_1779301 [Trichonephila clavipes]